MKKLVNILTYIKTTKIKIQLSDFSCVDSYLLDAMTVLFLNMCQIGQTVLLSIHHYYSNYYLSRTECLFYIKIYRYLKDFINVIDLFWRNISVFRIVVFVEISIIEKAKVFISEFDFFIYSWYISLRDVILNVIDINSFFWCLCTL